jgi:hypothetical protein
MAIKRHFRPEGTAEFERVSVVPSGLIGSLLPAIPTLNRLSLPTSSEALVNET